MFYVGQKVVCVDDGPFPPRQALNNGWYPGEELREGQIYSIKAVRKTKCGDEVVDLIEIRRSDASRRIHGSDVGYGRFRFRPVTDISQFHAMLTHQPLFKPAREDA